MTAMFALYVGCLIVGGGLVLLSFFSDHDSDADVDVDVDADVDVDFDGDVGHLDAGDLGPHGVGMADALWLPFLSLRFWIFFGAFFGLTGTLFSAFSLASWKPTLGVSLGVGFVTGYFVSWLVRKLRSEKVDSNIDPTRDYVGKRGDVLLDIVPGDPGMVRVEAKGISVDLPAELDDDEPPLERGEQVVVLAYQGGKLKVTRFTPPVPVDGA